jgi:7-cyano-7-deazaguanine synthase
MSSQVHKNKHAIVVLSGGMDSAICLALAVKNFGATFVSAITFDYGQRHFSEKESAQKIAKHFNVDHVTINLPFFSELTTNALLNHAESLHVNKNNSNLPNTLVVGRNGLFARLGAIHAHHLQASHLYLGVLGLEAANSGYLDCSRKYFDLMEQILRIDLATDNFWIHTPLVEMTKKQTLDLANELGALQFILENSITCYEGVKEYGCGVCAACVLRNNGIREFLDSNPNFNFSYRNKF